jgi:ATP-dependent helicase/nuclease subunit B
MKAGGKFLDERRVMDAAERRDMLLAREAERLAKASTGPVIAAGSTGTLPKVAELLRVIANLERGAVVLPGLDQELGQQAFALIGEEDEPMPGHPQFGLKRLIEKIGIAREAVNPLGKTAFPLRESILSLAFRPHAEDEESGRRIAPEHALEGVTIIEATDAREEALSIALALREALHENKTAALVTPDRALARRVRAELTRWEIDIDDSAGLPLADSEAGRLARLILMAAAEDTAPSTVLALLRHPYLRDLFAAEDVARFEIACLRGVRPAGGVSALPAAVNARRGEKHHGSDQRSHFEDADWDRAADVARKLSEFLAPLTALSRGDYAVVQFAEAQLASVSAALAGQATDDGEEILTAIEALIEAGRDAPAMDARGLCRILSGHDPRIHAAPGARREQAVAHSRTAGSPHDFNADRIVLGGLCEGIWPPEARTDSWLNRPMRQDLGLDLPERRIGLSAHDFVQAASAAELFLTRARKQSGVETIASRFVQRLAAVAGDNDWLEATANGEHYLRWARALEEAEREAPAQPPHPMPPVSARPRRFSMSDMRDLTRDPYSIYARKILRLQKLDAIDEEPGAADRGTLLHDILSSFAEQHPRELPASALDDLIAIGREAFAPMESYPAAFAIWWPRFERAAKWFVDEERERRGKIAAIHSEVNGSLEIGTGDKRFTLTARADRVEVNKDGSIAVLDFKTGTLPTYKEAILGFRAAIASRSRHRARGRLCRNSTRREARGSRTHQDFRRPAARRIQAFRTFEPR